MRSKITSKILAGHKHQSNLHLTPNRTGTAPTSPTKWLREPTALGCRHCSIHAPAHGPFRTTGSITDYKPEIKEEPRNRKPKSLTWMQMTSGSRRATNWEKAGQSLFIRRSRLLAFHVRNLRGSSPGLPSSPPAPATAGASPESVAAVGLFLDGEPSLGTGWKKRFIASGRRRRAGGSFPRNWTESPAGNVTRIYFFEINVTRITKT